MLLDIVLPSKQSQNYRRELDLETGIASVSYTNGAAKLFAVAGCTAVPTAGPDPSPDASASSSGRAFTGDS